MPSALAFTLLVAGLVSAMGCVNAAIRWGLRAPRVVEGRTPADLDMAYSEVRIPSVGGKSLFAWLVPVAGAKEAPVLVVMHGWGGNAEMMLPLARPLSRAGFALLLVDARNHGKSDADNFSSLPRFAEDLDHAIEWLKAQSGTTSDRIGLVGHSVGAAAGLLVASRRHDLAAVVSIASFAHPEIVMRRMLRAWRIPYLPLGWYVLRYVQRVIGHRFDDIAPLNTIAQVRCPVLLVHGTDDALVPVGDARALQVCRGRGVGGLLLVKGSHDAYDELEREVSEVVGFLDRAMRGHDGTPPSFAEARLGAEFSVNRIKTRWCKNEIGQSES